MRVMIVDDSKVARRILKEQFELLGCEVIAEAQDGIEGLNILKEIIPDLITVDIEMPNMNGITMIDQIYRKYREIRIIVVSSVVSKKVINKAVIHGASTVLTKPIDIEELRQIIEEGKLNGNS